MSSLSSLSPTSLLPSNSSSSAISSSSAGQLAVGGLISGLNTNAIIQGLLAIDQQKIDAITAQESTVTSQQTAFKAVEADLLTLQGSMTQLSKSQNGLFDARTATPSDTTALTAAASGSAVAGVYQLRINSLAQANQIASQGFDSATSSLTHGTLQIKIGDATTSLTVDSSNDTLQGLADAINNSGAAVSANVVNDGSGDGQQGYRLVLSAQATGASNRIVITNNLSGTAAGATQPIFDTGTIGNVSAASSNSGTATVQSNAGAGYTGTANDVYQFTVVTGGTVGTDDGLQLSYADASGAHTGTITVNHGDVNNPLTVAQGVTLQLGAGTLVAGDSFSVKTFVPTIQAAADASVTMGSGSGALTVTSAKNQIDSLIPGVAMNLLNADPAKTLTLTVANDTTNMTKGIQDFVTSYNTLMSDIDAKTSYSSDTQTAGVLLGNQQVLTIQDQVRSVVTGVVAGANPLMNHLGALGITTDDNGQLVVDSTKLSSALAGTTTGVTLNDVRKLFSLSGSSTSPGVQFVTGSTKTLASTSPYTVNITQAADEASLASSSPTADSTVIDSTNNSLTVSIDGLTSSVLSLTPGAYTRSALAQMVQAAINGDPTLVGRSVNVAVQGNQLTLTSNQYGAASQISMLSGTALPALGFAGGESAQGHDVVGNFVVNGVTETARGSGQFLIGDPTNANTADLQLRVTLTPAQVGSGTSASVTVSRGIASGLDSVLTGLLDPITGRLKTVDDSYQQTLTDLDQEKTTQTNLMQAHQTSLQQQFTAMEQTLSQLQSASNFLAQQAASVQKTA